MPHQPSIETLDADGRAEIEVSEIREGYLNLNGWAGLTSQRVEIVGETPKRLRIRAISRTKLAGRRRWIEAGTTALVPTYAVTTEPRGAVVDFKSSTKGGV